MTAPDARRRASVAALTCAVALAAFAALAALVTASGRPAFDTDLVERAVAARSQALTDAMLWLAWATSGYGVAVVAVAVCAYLLWRRRIGDAIVVGAAAAGAGILTAAVKEAFREPRPSVAEPLGPASGFSFPSGHALSTMALLAALVYVAGPGRLRVAIAVVGGLIVAAVGVSRAVLSAHYPTDVLAGWALAIAWVAAVVAVDALVRGRREPQAAPPERRRSAGTPPARPVSGPGQRSARTPE